jgi:DNA (cytosine-5)-methyltransferase 1
MFKVLDLYCGMGGLSLGFALAIDNVSIRGLDINKNAVDTYNLNLNRFNANATITDVLEWKPDDEYDVIIGGSPCQPFSTANTQRKGENHPYFPTLSRYFDIVSQTQPSVFLLENVKGLLSKRFIGYFEKQLEKVTDRYNVLYQLLNAAYYGVPQRRERVFVIGIRKDLGIKPSFPSFTHDKVEWVTIEGKRVFKWITLREAIGDIMNISPIINPLSPEQVEKIKAKRISNPGSWSSMKFPDSLDEPSRTIAYDTVTGTKRETIVIPSEHVMTLGTGWTKNGDWGSRVMLLDKPSFTIVSAHRSGQLIETVYRKLTVREVLRIQSFPDWWRFPENVSTSSKFKLVGEAVPPILAYKLVTHIAKLMNWKTREPPSKDEWNLPYFKRAFAEYTRI